MIAPNYATNTLGAKSILIRHAKVKRRKVTTYKHCKFRRATPKDGSVLVHRVAQIDNPELRRQIALLVYYDLMDTVGHKNAKSLYDLARPLDPCPDKTWTRREQYDAMIAVGYTKLEASSRSEIGERYAVAATHDWYTTVRVKKSQEIVADMA